MMAYTLSHTCEVSGGGGLPRPFVYVVTFHCYTSYKFEWGKHK
jgi:hypothetical protein